MKTSDLENQSGGSAWSVERTPCRQIELDLSAMIDGELDAPSVRRVMVHSDVCPSCRGFLEGIRMQLCAHRELATRFQLTPSEMGLDDRAAEDQFGAGWDPDESRVRMLRDELLRNRRQLARILYEMGRSYVLMGVSPSFSTVVAREPVPIPDVYAVGQNLLDEVSRSADGANGAEWVRAKQLFTDGELHSPQENMTKGKRLLCETLLLRPSFHEARIFLGHAYHVSGEPGLARREFDFVLETAADPIMQAFALENLGNVYLEQGHRAESISYFLRLVESGVIEREPRFFTTYFNLALAYGLLRQFGPCHGWLSRLYTEFPHKQRLIGGELRGRRELVETLRAHAQVEAKFAQDFPAWFPIPVEEC